jgi:hypothetical protein
MDNVKFSIEIPTSLLTEISPLIDFDFVIASTYLIDKEYRNYYLNNKQRYVILDNGAFENGESIPIRDYINVMLELNPDIVVIPDVRHEYEKTLFKVDEFLGYFPDMDTSIFMGVLQGKSTIDYEDLLEKYQRNNIRLIGVPYGTIDRITFIRNHPDISFHILGLPYFPELLSLRLLPNVVSIDTSLPVKYAGWGKAMINFDTLTIDERPKILNNIQTDRLKESIGILRRMCDRKTLICTEMI